MSDYKNVTRELQAGTSPDLICGTCPWDRLCVSPPAMSSADIDRLMDQVKVDTASKGKDGTTAVLLTALAFAGRDVAGELCPVFALRLQGPDGRQVADGIRTQMREWKSE